MIETVQTNDDRRTRVRLLCQNGRICELEFGYEGAIQNRQTVEDIKT
jgi:hypothetical protein